MKKTLCGYDRITFIYILVEFLRVWLDFADVVRIREFLIKSIVDKLTDDCSGRSFLSPVVKLGYTLLHCFEKFDGDFLQPGNVSFLYFLFEKEIINRKLFIVGEAFTHKSLFLAVE